MHRNNPTDPTLPEAAGLPSSEPAVASIAGLADIENALRQIIQAVSTGQDNRIEPLVEQLGTLIQSLDPADKAGAATPQDLQRVMDLWKQTSLAIASASQQACAELQHIAAGRSSLLAYRS